MIFFSKFLSFCGQYQLSIGGLDMSIWLGQIANNRVFCNFDKKIRFLRPNNVVAWTHLKIDFPNIAFA